MPGVAYGLAAFFMSPLHGVSDRFVCARFEHGIFPCAGLY